MPNLFSGIADLVATTTTLGANNLLVPLYPFNFTFASEVTTLQAQGQSGGILQTLASKQGATTNTLTISTQYVDWGTLEFYTNERSAAEVAPVFPITKTAVIPVSSPHEIVDAAIVTATIPSIRAAVSSTASGIELRTIVSGAPSAGQIQATNTGTKLVFNAADAGKTVTYVVNTTYANTRSLGGTNSSPLGTFSLRGLTDTGAYIEFPSVDFSTAPSFTFTGETAELSIECSANVPVTLGWRKPYKLYQALVAA